MPTPNPDELGAQAEKLIKAGRFDTALPLIERSAALLVEAGRFGDAVDAFVGAARLAVLANQLSDGRRLLASAAAPAQLAKKMPELLRAQAELAERAEGVPGALAGWRRAAEAGDEKIRRHALLRMAEIAIGRQQPKEAWALYGEALADAERRQDRRDTAALLIERSICSGAMGDTASANTDLDRADTLLDEGDGLRARSTGQRAVMAFHAGDLDRALELGTRSRDLAEKAADVMALLPAVALLAGIHQRRGEEVLAYGTLVSARDTVVRLRGEEAAGLVKPLLASLEQSLGSRASAVRQAWRDRRD